MGRHLNGDIRLYEYVLTRSINGDINYRIQVQIIARATKASLIGFELTGLYRCNRATLVGCYPMEKL